MGIYIRDVVKYVVLVYILSMYRILISTMHRGDNYGSALQVYALSEILKKLGHHPIVLDYIPKRINLNNQVWGLLKQLLLPKSLGDIKGAIRGLAITLTNYRCYNTFFKREVTLTKKYYSYKEVEKANIKANVYMTGSDQVWNSTHNHGIDPVFFLKFAPEKAIKFPILLLLVKRSLMIGKRMKRKNY